MLRAASNFIDAADIPLAGVDRVILPVLVDPRAEAGRAELQGHYDYTANRVIFATLQTFCETALVQNQIFVLCHKSTTDGGCFA
jgi:hypothetical protein